MDVGCIQKQSLAGSVYIQRPRICGVAREQRKQFGRRPYGRSHIFLVIGSLYICHWTVLCHTSRIDIYLIVSPITVK